MVKRLQEQQHIITGLNNYISDECCTRTRPILVIITYTYKLTGHVHCIGWRPLRTAQPFFSLASMSSPLTNSGPPRINQSRMAVTCHGTVCPCMSRRSPDDLQYMKALCQRHCMQVMTWEVLSGNHQCQAGSVVTSLTSDLRGSSSQQWHCSQAP